jgi:uncharacterized damage-inducible protein DinB
MEALMKDTFLHWFRFNHTANQRIIDVMRDAEEVPEEALRLMSHLLNAHLVWLNRMHELKELEVPEIWQEHELTSLTGLNDQCLELSEWFVQAENYGMSLAKVIRYQNSKGHTFESSVKEIYFHQLMHAMYHRGQVARELRKAGIQPPVTDYIMLTRDQVEEKGIVA